MKVQKMLVRISICIGSRKVLPQRLKPFSENLLYAVLNRCSTQNHGFHEIMACSTRASCPRDNRRDAGAAFSRWRYL
jgi:hypothetical protein